jgi:AAA domain
MTNPQPPTDFVVTREHRRFAEFCDACKRYRYIGLCYGVPGVGKTLSARHYATWDKVQAYQPHGRSPETALHEVLGSDPIVYTPGVVNSPGQVERDIQQRRHTLRVISQEPINREEQARRQEL